MLEWREELAVGDPVIDDDHKHLIKLVNAYEGAITERNPRQLKNALDGLVTYAKEHFEREENVMLAVHFPHRISHMQQHEELLIKIQKFHDEMMKAHALDIEEVSRFLHDWLVEHVVKEDLQLRPYRTGGRH